MNATTAKAKAATLPQDIQTRLLATDLAGYAGGNLPFLVWLYNVDLYLRRRVATGVLDIADASYRDMYDDGMDHREAAREALERDDTFCGVADLL